MRVYEKGECEGGNGASSGSASGGCRASDWRGGFSTHGLRCAAVEGGGGREGDQEKDGQRLSWNEALPQLPVPLQPVRVAAERAGADGGG